MKAFRVEFGNARKKKMYRMSQNDGECLITLPVLAVALGQARGKAHLATTKCFTVLVTLEWASLLLLVHAYSRNH